MTALTLVHTKGEARADSRLIAVELQNQHKNVMELIDRYIDKFKGFGVVPFKTEKPTGAKGGRPERFALLNEDQCFFLLSLSRNTDHVVDLKAKLVKAFSEARAGKGGDAVEYLPGYHQMHDLAHDLAQGSPNERFLHMNLNKLVNRTVGIGSGLRTDLPAPVRSLTVVAQTVAIKAMEGAADHHEGYEKAKKALETLGTALNVRAA